MASEKMGTSTLALWPILFLKNSDFDSSYLSILQYSPSPTSIWPSPNYNPVGLFGGRVQYNEYMTV